MDNNFLPIVPGQKPTPPLHKQAVIVYSGINFILFYCSIELFDTFLL